MTADSAREASAVEPRDAWITEQLERVGPLTQQQQTDLRRVLLPPKPLPKPA